MNDLKLRKELIQTVLKMNGLGINQGTSGNAAVRSEDGYLITPSGMSYEDISPDDVVFKKFGGEYASPNGLRNLQANGGSMKIYLLPDKMSKPSFIPMARRL